MAPNFPLPLAFTSRIRHQLGDEYDFFIASLADPAPVSVRLNPARRITDFDQMERVRWATDAYYLPERISFTLDPLFHSGCYYVQEASSMFLEYALKRITVSGNSYSILDLCAAPGGKSTHILSTLSPESLLVSNEIIPSRNNILRHNLTKWGQGNVIVTQNEARDFSRLPGFFDIVVVDAPCSGEGLFRKQPEAINEWSGEAVINCATRQKGILDAVIPALKDGGYLVYCTCTWETDENESQVERLVTDFDMERVDLDVPFGEIVASESGYRFYPHRVKGEGFFMAVLRKKGSGERIPVRNSSRHASSVGSGLLEEWFSVPKRFIALQRDQEWYAVPERHVAAYTRIRDHLYIRKAGIHMGTLKGADLVPSHEMALCNYLHADLKRVELDKQDAIEFLRCGVPSITVPPKGWYLATFRNYPLGWFKSVGSRINNYFPKEFRIVKDPTRE